MKNIFIKKIIFKSNNKLKNKAKKLNIEIYVADIETTLINNKHIPLIIGYKKLYSDFEKLIYINNINNLINDSEKIIYDFLNFFILISKKKKINIYFHNLGSFDGIFLINIINKFSHIEPFNKCEIIIRNNKIYEIKILNLIIRDSFNLFPISLKKLSNELLNYDKSKKNIDYNLFNNPLSFLKNINEIIEYTKYDLISLEEIIKKLFETIKNEYNIDIRHTLTISSLAFKIFRSKFMIKENIHKSNLDNNLEKFLRKSYFGGLTNVFKPKIKKCYYYDVNSLYPYSMLNFMPIGIPK